MDERAKQIVDNLDSLKIGLDEQFKFGCTMCGKCCINREDILLSPRDIYRMSKELGISTEDLFKQYCETYVGTDSRIPIVRLQPRGSVKRCPLLKNRKCMVHRAKPAVCAMFPIGRCLMAENPKEGFRDFSKARLQYIFMNPECGDKSETHTVREYLESFGVPIEDEFFMEWQRTVLRLGDICRKIEKEVRMEVMEQVWTAAFIGLYLYYDTEADFMPQFKENAQKFFDMLDFVLQESDYNPET